MFIDEIDSLLSQRGDGEHDSTRRIKTEFLVQLDGATTSCEERLLVVGATNRSALTRVTSAIMQRLPTCFSPGGGRYQQVRVLDRFLLPTRHGFP